MGICSALPAFLISLVITVMGTRALIFGSREGKLSGALAGFLSGTLASPPIGYIVVYLTNPSSVIPLQQAIQYAFFIPVLWFCFWVPAGPLGLLLVNISQKSKVSNLKVMGCSTHQQELGITVTDGKALVPMRDKYIIWSMTGVGLAIWAVVLVAAAYLLFFGRDISGRS